ncbi:MAG: chromosome segregation protein SMC [Clostridia bacterium]|nr:chromosome segregation protein SMC [Clostridia bacterium]
MLLKSLEIQGFKTFPDKTILKFDDPFVAVVGPNGSGKSNVSDALRWVLGEQSTKALRCAKMEDVIFKGASGRKAMGYAEVTLNIDNSGRELDFDNDNISVSRRFYRSGESEYLINNAQVRLKDINELFMDTGLGRDGYSMIGQGKIDSIVSAKSEERREIFEEASGISRYRYKKEESERRLERTEDNLIRLRDILGELEDRVGPLRVQAQKAEKFIEYDTEKKSLEVGIWVVQLSDSERQIRNQEDKISLAQGDYNKIDSELNATVTQMEENYKLTNELTTQIEELRTASASMSEEAAKIDGDISVLNNDIEHNRSDIIRLKQELETSKFSAADIDLQIEESEMNLSEKNESLTALNKKFAEKSEELDTAKKEGEEINGSIIAEQNKVLELNNSIAQNRIVYSAAESSLVEINSRGSSIDSAISENITNTKKLIKVLYQLKQDSEDNRKSIAGCNNTLSGHNMKLGLKRKKAETLQSELNHLTLDIGEKERRAKILEDLEKNFEGFAQSVRAVMRDASHGILKGIHGPVTQLIHTDSKYSVAIEIALGGAAQNIVVDGEREAKDTINYLKRKNIGRATFLPLTNIRGNRISSKEFENLSGYIGIASDLTHYDQKYADINLNLLGRTIVVDNLDSASVIAKRISYRNRIVTLDGQVINAGGSFTGGSLAKNSGLLDRSNQIAKIKSEAEELRKTQEEKTAEYKALTEEISSASAEIKLTEQTMQELTHKEVVIGADISRIEKEISVSEQRGKELLAEKQDSANRIKALTDQMNALDDEYNKANEMLAESRSTLDSLSFDIMHYQTYSSEINNEIQNIRIDIVTVEKDRDSLIETITNLKTQKEEKSGAEDRITGRIQELENHTAELSEKIVKLKEEAENKRVTSSDSIERINSLTEKRTEIEGVSSNLRNAERELTSKRENISLELARLNDKKESLSSDYEIIVAKLWDEYELTRREAEEQAIVIEDLSAARKRLTELRNKIKALGSVNVGAVVEYKEVSERYNFLREQISDVEKSRLSLIKLIAQLTEQMEVQYHDRFKEIAENFSEIFKELFGGGTASLEFSEKDDILNSGIDIRVHPPGKIVSNIEALSGGEKALVAISIYFAIMKVSPPPFCMLDEVEAALDDSNVTRFAEYLHRMNDNTQFIVVTHRRPTMESADSLYGVTMQDDGISRVLALEKHEA